MAWDTPTLKDVRKRARDDISSKIPGADANVPNSNLRVIAEANAGLAFDEHLYLAWLSQQVLPDTADEDWLVRHANIWLKRGRKSASFASGSVTMTGSAGVVVPAGTLFSYAGSSYQSSADVTLGARATAVPLDALTAGTVGNLDAGTALQLSTAISGADASAIVDSMTGGTDDETDDELRARVLERIRKPPQGGDADDYVAWALEVDGVTRAWCAPNEMGPGTVTVRFMMDDLRATDDPTTSGFPTDDDVATVRAYLDTVRPVTLLDFFVEAPIPEPVNISIGSLDSDTTATRNAIAAALAELMSAKASPSYSTNGVLQDAQTIYAVWMSEAISSAAGVDHFELLTGDHLMPSNGCMAVLGTITYS